MPSHDPHPAPAAPAGAAKSFDVFLSYSRRDEAAVHSIAAALQRRGLAPWLDRWSVTAGRRWKDDIARGLAASGACAVFIGDRDLGAWEREEVDRAVERAVEDPDFRVFAVLLPGVDPLDPGAVPPFLRARTWVDLRAGPQDPRGLDDLIHAIQGSPFGPDVMVDADDHIVPYRGLRVFEAEHARFFFGRDRDVQRLLERLKHGRFLAVLGASGSGKSSLVRAGLVPALRAGRLRESDAWPVVVVRFGTHPLESLAAASATFDKRRPLTAILADLIQGDRGLHLAAQSALVDRPPRDRAVLVIDQLEEAFTLCSSDKERTLAFDNLAYAASRPGGRTIVIVTMRADFYPRLAEHPRIAQLVESSQELVGALGRDELRQAIDGPAHRVGVDVAPGLADTIIDDAGADPGALPLLEHALLETWLRAHGGGLTHEAYAMSGGVTGAVAKRADEVYDELSAAEQAIARRLLLRLTEPGEGVPDTRRRAPLAELRDGGPDGDALESIITRFTDERLLTTELDESGTGCVEIAHEALIRGWPRLRSWIDERRVALVLERRITVAAAEWQRHGRDESALHRGPQLAEALEADERGDLDLTEREREFLAESRKRDYRERRAHRRRRAFALGGAAALCIAIAFVAITFVEQRRRARLADAAELAARSTAAVDTDPAAALRLALASIDTSATPQGDAALRQSTVASRELMRVRADSTVGWSASPSPDGKRAVTGGADGVARLWDVASGRELQSLPGQRGRVFTVRYSPSGRRIAVGYENGTVVITDAALRALRAILMRGGYVSAVAVDGTDSVLAAAVERGARVASLDGSPRVRRLGGEQRAYSIDITADGARVASGSEGDDHVRVWDARTGELVHALPAAGIRVTARWSPDGTKLLGAGDHVTVWDATSGDKQAHWSGGGRPLWGAAASRDGRTVVAAGEDGVIREWTWDGAVVDQWRADTGEIMDVGFLRGDRVLSLGVDGRLRVSKALAADAWNGDDVDAVEFDPEQKLLAGGNADGTVHVWDLATHRVKTLRGTGGYTDATFSPDGDTLLINRDGGGTIRAWPTSGGGQALILKAPNDELLNTVEFDRTGDHVAWSTDKRVVVRDLKSGQDVVYGGVRDDMTDVRISPNGAHVAAAGSSGVIKLWHRDQPAKPYAVLRGHDGAVNTIGWSPQGDRIVSAGADLTVRIWNPRDGSAVILRGHTLAANSAVFTPSGSHVVSASGDGTVRLWDVRGDRASVVLESRPDGLNDATLAPDGHTVASTGDDGIVHVFDCEVCGSSADVLADARSRVR